MDQPPKPRIFGLRWWRGTIAPRDSLVLGLALALLAALPVLLAAHPQMTDYPSHLARYHVMLSRADSPFLQQYYDFEWRWSGNLGADILIRPLAAPLGLEAAGRLIVLIIPVLTGLAIVTTEWTLRRRFGLGGLLAFTQIWQPALLMGFLNYSLALALALLAFSLWVRLEGKTWRAPLFIPIGGMVWLCHVSGWGVLGLMVFGYEWSRGKSWRAALATWPLAFPLLALIAAQAASSGLSPYGPRPLRWKALLWARAMRDQIEWLDKASLAAITLAIAAALGLRRIDGRLGWAALLMLVGSLLLPRHILGGDYADYRLISAGLLAACLAIGGPAPRWAMLAALALFAGRLGVTSAAWLRNGRETEILLAAVDHLPRGAKVASLVAVDNSAWGFNPFEHIGSYATVRRDALVNSHFAVPGLHMLTLREGGPGFRDPSQRRFTPPRLPVDLDTFEQARGMDYLWYAGQQPAGRLPPGARVIYRTNHSLLSRLAMPLVDR